MNIGRLSQDELAYEMIVRGLKVDTVEVMRKALRSSRLLERRGSMDSSKSYPFSFEEDIKAVKAKIEEIRGLLKDTPKNPKSSEYIKIVTKIEWSMGRLNRAEGEDDGDEDCKSGLKNELLIMLGTLTGDGEESDREEPSPRKKTSSSTQFRSPAVLNSGRNPVVEPNGSGLGRGPPSVMEEQVVQDVERTATAEVSVRVPVGEIGRGVFAREELLRNTNERRIPNEKCSERVGKWGVKFTGESDGSSVNSFLERVEELRVANDVPETHLFKSATELLTGKALLWFRTVRDELNSWQELIKEIKAEFLPANYDDLLLEEINRRSQGKDETFGAYLAVMRTLFRRLSEPITEGRKLTILRKNVDPFYQQQIAFAKPTSVKELAILGRDLDTLKINMETFTPPSRGKNLLEPECGYRPSSVVQHRVAVIEPDAGNSRSSQQRKVFKCFNCNREGHFASACPTPKKCFGCGTAGVSRRDCRRCSGNGPRTLGTAGRELRRN